MAAYERSGASIVYSDDRFASLVRVLPGSHDEGFKVCRAVAEEFILLARSKINHPPISAETICGIVRECLSIGADVKPIIMFSVLTRHGRTMFAVSCGINVISVWRACNSIRILDAQSMGNKLRSEGKSEIPFFAESIALIAGTEYCKESDIQMCELEIQTGDLYSIFADSLLEKAVAEELAGKFVDKRLLEAGVTRVLVSFSNANPACVIVDWK